VSGRIKIARIFFVALLALISIRAFDIQILRPDSIISAAHKRFDHTIKLSPHRGTIFDKSGQPLAISLEVDSIAANPRLIKNPAWAASKLSKTLQIEQRSLRRKLESDRYFVWIKRHASPDEITTVKSLNIRGIGYYSEAKRFYSESESLANVLGIVGIDGHGLEGIELLFDHALKGKERHIEVRKDGLGRIIYARGMPSDDNKDGNTLWLTIDRRMQYIAFSELEKAVKDNKAKSGFVIITNPMTGEIYAMSSYPSFNPNIGTYRNLDGHKNRGVVHIFEPGSVIKPFFVSWGLEHKIFKPSQSIFCENGKITYHRTTIHDHEEYGWLPVRDIIKYSSNIGMVKLFDPVHAADMYSCLKDFGLISASGIDFPGEGNPLVRDSGRWTSVDKANISFGQGIAVNGVQLITAFNALINGGMLMKPYLIEHVADASGKEILCYRPTIVRKVISKDTSDEILGILTSVCSKGGTAEAAAVGGYQVFGKTGTSQKIDPLTGAYSRKDCIATFIGGVIDATGKPRLTIIASIDEPHPYHFASIVACPLFKRIVEKCAGIMDLSPAITVARKGVPNEDI